MSSGSRSKSRRSSDSLKIVYYVVELFVVAAILIFIAHNLLLQQDSSYEEYVSNIKARYINELERSLTTDSAIVISTLSLMLSFIFVKMFVGTSYKASDSASYGAIITGLVAGVIVSTVSMIDLTLPFSTSMLIILYSGFIGILLTIWVYFREIPKN